MNTSMLQVLLICYLVQMMSNLLIVKVHSQQLLVFQHIAIKYQHKQVSIITTQFQDQLMLDYKIVNQI